MSNNTNFDDNFFDDDEYDEPQFYEYDIHPMKAKQGGGGTKTSVYSSKCVRAKEALMEKAKNNNTIKMKTEPEKKETGKKKGGKAGHTIPVKFIL